MESKKEWGLVGLGKMGANLALQALEKGMNGVPSVHPTVLYRFVPVHLDESALRINQLSTKDHIWAVSTH